MANLGEHVRSAKVVMATLVLGSVVMMLSSMSSTSYAQTSIADEFLTAHNDVRAAVGPGPGPMVWNDTLAAYAQSYADSQTAGGDCLTLVHSGGPYGENLAVGYSTPTTVVDAWVSESQYYDYDTNTCAANQVCGHYTQVVWNNSVNLGCAMVTCPENIIYSICSYYPAGNYVGEKPY